MAKMPQVEAGLRARLTQYALGVLAESGWILAMCVLAYLMAVVAIALYGGAR